MSLRTPLYDFHVSCGAKMVDFAGWEMPLLYRGIVEEHRQTRDSGSLFDVSHMGRIHFRGRDAVTLLDKALTRNVAQMRIGQSRYSLVCNESGGVLDDVIVSKDVKHWLLVCNAANRAKILRHMQQVREQGKFETEIVDQTESTAMVAVQGPKVIELVSDVLGINVRSIKRYGFENGTHMLSRYTLFRSGYTGEDGVEMIISAATARSMVESLGREMCRSDSLIKPAGLGARDTLRLEAAMPLYGQELTESLDPISAGLGWAVDLNKEFLGVQPLRTIAERGPARKLAGLELSGPRIARHGCAVRSGPAVIGEITSGTFSPTLQKSVALAYLDAGHVQVGTSVDVDLRGTAVAAKLVPLPFYKRSG